MRIRFSWRLHALFSCLISFYLISCGSEEHSQVDKKKKLERPSMSSLDDFQPTGDNWIMVDEPLFGLEKPNTVKYSKGNNAILNLNNQVGKGANKHLFSKMEHADIDLEMEVMMPKGSNSGIYFQSRYEIQLLDSWGVTKPKHSDIGGIYQRWDESLPEGEKGYEGIAPPVNAAKAPGVWQHFSISFIAPRFNDQGEKISNAIFKSVTLNGVLLHENKELTGPTRAAVSGKEVAFAPLMIQGDHGPVAIRNIKYKAYQDIQVSLQDLTFKYAEGEFEKIPDFDTLEIIAEGKAESFNILNYAARNERYAIQFQGKLIAPSTGVYLFDLTSGDGTNFYIDDKFVVGHDKRHWRSTRTGIVELTKGEHSVRLDAFEYQYVPAVTLGYEGPGIKYQYLPSTPPRPGISASDHILLEVGDKSILQRCFMDFYGESMTLAVAVGNPEKLHYAVDLGTGSLIKTWRGGFADMTGMWHSRGESQQLEATGTGVYGAKGLIINQLYGLDTPWKDKDEFFKSVKYELQELNRPVFTYQYMNTTLEDRIVPNTEIGGLTRTLTLSGLDKNIYARVATAPFINDLGNGLYSIQNEFYIQLDPSVRAFKRRSEGAAELLLPLNGSVSYTLIW